MANADDYEAVRALIHEYCFRIDAGDLDGLAELFDRAELGSSVAARAHARSSTEARHYYDGVILYDDGTPDDALHHERDDHDGADEPNGVGALATSR